MIYYLAFSTILSAVLIIISYTDKGYVRVGDVLRSLFWGFCPILNLLTAFLVILDYLGDALDALCEAFGKFLDIKLF